MNPNSMLKRFLLMATFTFALMVIGVLAIGAQELQKGVSVQMPVTTSAVSMPEADYNDAWVVAVTEDGSLYFGAKAVSYDELLSELRTQPRRRDAKLYIKADARAPFASLEKTLQAARESSFVTAVLLTAQPESPAPGVMVPPKGIEVSLTTPVDAPFVQLDPGQPAPRLTISNGDQSWAGLKNSIRLLVQNREDKTVTIRAAGQVRVLQVVYAMDVAQSAGAKVAVPVAAI